MTRKECLEQAMGCVLRDRNNEYGEPEQSFHYIADLWSAYLRTKIEPYDAAAMMALFKLARLRFNPYYEDGWTDLAGYAACGAELAGAEKARENATRMWGEEYKRLSAEAEGGCCQNENDQPEFKHGDRVQANTGPNGKWEDMVYYCKDFAGNHLVGVENAVSSGDILYVADAVRPVPKADEEPKFKPGDRVQCRVTLPSVSDRLWVDGEYVRYEKELFRHHVVRTRASHFELVSDEDIRPAPKAEGCEDLVFDEARMRESMPGIVPQDGPRDFDAPQTKEALFRHIVDCNPATYGRARKPTGEELAEMAEEDAHV